MLAKNSAKIKKKSVYSYLFIICSFLVYLGAYIIREILGTVSPQLLEGRVFDEATLGVFSSIMFASYGIGQLINGLLGEKLNVKLMISAGLMSAAGCTVCFALTDSLPIRYALWAVCGYALSMLYGPLTKTIATHLEGNTARIAYNFLSVGAILGATAAGFIAGVCGTWRMTFFVSAAMLAVPLALFLFVNSRFEKMAKEREALSEGAEGSVDDTAETQKFSLRTFISCFGITTVCFLIVNMLIKAARHAVSFWAPTYISSALGYDAKASAVIFGLMSAIKVVAPFFAIWLYRRVRENERVIVFGSMIISAICFFVMLIARNAVLELVLFTAALFFVECGGAIIGSVFLLSFKRFGCVSAICGFFDSTAYLTAAVCSVLFSRLLADGGWTTVLCIWTVLPAMAALVIAVVINKRKFTVSSERRKRK